jgi:hypothetical protein
VIAFGCKCKDDGRSGMQAARFRFLTIVAGALLISACGGGGGSDSAPPVTGPPPPPEPGFVALQSDPGDAIGEGLDYRYTQADARLLVSTGERSLQIFVNGDEEWSGAFELPDTYTQVEVGVYSNLGRYPFHDPVIGGMSWSGAGRQCDQVTGSFEVTSVTYVNGLIVDIRMNFEQYCDGASVPLRGVIHWYVDDQTFPPGPVRPPPTALWRPEPGTTPESGDYVYLESEAGDTMGEGNSYLYTPDVAQFSVNGHNRIFGIAVIGSETWIGSFEAMDFLVEIERGYYPDLLRYGEHNPVKGGLYWRGEGRSCGEISGWVAIDDINYIGAEIQSIRLRFEQRCEDDAGVLHGEIAWSQ